MKKSDYSPARPILTILRVGRGGCIIVLVTLLTGLSGFASAGIFDLTHTSRANCVNNESISWEAGGRWLMGVWSSHYKIYGNLNGLVHAPVHHVFSGIVDGWRAAAIHSREAYPHKPDYVVFGQHWVALNKHRTLYRRSFAVDCNLAEGWL